MRAGLPPVFRDRNEITGVPRTRRPVPARNARRSVVLGSLGFIGKIVLPIVLLAAIAIGILYVRLLNGPVSVGFLASSISQAINAEMEGLYVEVPEAVVQVIDGRFQFLLKQVKLVDANEAPVAVVPLAAFDVSLNALAKGRIAPSRIVLIEPRLLLYYSPDGGLSLSFPQSAAKSEGRLAPGSPATVAASVVSESRPAAQESTGDAEGPRHEAFGRIDLTRTIVTLAKHARRGHDAASFFESVGLRDATVVFDHGGTQSVWRVPTANFDLSHFDRRSVLSGGVTVASTKGFWRLALEAEESETSQTVDVHATARDVDLDSLGEALPQLAALKMLHAEVNASVRLSLTSEGDVRSANIDFELAKGHVAIPWLAKAPPRFDGARLAIAYKRGRSELVVQPSSFKWANSEITVGGTIAPDRGVADGGGDWRFDLVALNGSLSPQSAWAPKQAITDWLARGRFSASDSVLHLERVLMKTATGSAMVAGRVFMGAKPGYDLSGGFSQMPAESLLVHWPEFLAPAGRTFFGDAVKGGSVSGGDFTVMLREQPAKVVGAAGSYDWSSSVELKFKDLQFAGDKDLPPILAPEAKFLLSDDHFAFTFEKGTFVSGGNRGADVSDFRFDARKIYAKPLDAQLKLRMAGSVPQLAALLDGRPFGWSPLPADLRGKLAGNFDLRLDGSLPLVRPDGVEMPPPDITGQLRLLEGSGKALFGGQDVSNGTIIVDFGSKVVSARGKLLVGRVPATLNWQHIVGAPIDKQPPARLSATLDAADRAALGMAVNHIVQGDVDLDIEWLPKNGLSGDIHVRADLTKADVAVESLAWRKPAGQTAGLEFDVISTGTKVTGLDNIRMGGDGVAIEGRAKLGGGGEITAFDFPLFSIDTVTKLQLKGVRENKDLWRVSVSGRTFEGQDFFRSLFSVGRIKPVGAEPGVSEPSLELDVNVSSVLGFWNSALRDVSVRLTKQRGKLEQLTAHGTLKSGKHLQVRVDRSNRARVRQLVAESDDAGAAFELVGFYPNARGGRMRLIVNLDGSGPAEKTGVLAVERFGILGDPIVSEMAAAPEGGIQGRRVQNRTARAVREVIAFDWMKVPFSVGHGQFAMKNAELRGPLVGAVLNGSANFSTQRVDLWGTYIPLQGLNSALGGIPVLGQILAGPRGEGMLGMTFAVRGAMAEPEFLVHPLSLVTPGIFREMFQLQSAVPRVTPQDDAVARAIRRTPPPGSGWRKRAFETAD
jgi:hypothetical protein